MMYHFEILLKWAILSNNSSSALWHFFLKRESVTVKFYLKNEHCSFRVQLTAIATSNIVNGEEMVKFGKLR